MESQFWFYFVVSDAENSTTFTDEDYETMEIDIFSWARLLYVLQSFFAQALFIVSALYVLTVAISVELFGKRKNAYHSHQRLSLISTIVFLVVHVYAENEEMCTFACVAIQYLFTVFLTLIVMEFVQTIRSSKMGSESVGQRVFVCCVSWVIPMLPILITADAFQDPDALCWLNMGPELAFSTMLPLIVASSTIILLVEIECKRKSIREKLDHGHFYILTCAWLLYFTSIMTITYSDNLVYALCFGATCFALAQCISKFDEDECGDGAAENVQFTPDDDIAETESEKAKTFYFVV